MGKSTLNARRNIVSEFCSQECTAKGPVSTRDEGPAQFESFISSLGFEQYLLSCNFNPLDVSKLLEHDVQLKDAIVPTSECIVFLCVFSADSLEKFF